MTDDYSKWNILTSLPSEVIELANHTRMFNEVMSIRGEVDLQFSENIEASWQSLYRWVAGGRLCPLAAPGIGDEQATVGQWLEDRAHLEGGQLFDHDPKVVMPAPKVKSIPFWCSPVPIGRMFTIKGPIGPGTGRRYNYLDQICDELDLLWRKIGSSRLKSVDWQAETDYIRLMMHWHGQFESRTQFNPLDSLEPFWLVKFQSDQPGYCFTATNTVLLNAQLLSRMSIYKLRIDSVERNILTMSLLIPKVEAFPLPHLLMPERLPDKVLKQLEDYIYPQAAVGYIEASEHLESILQIEVEHMKSRISDRQYKNFHAVLDRLSSIRTSFIAVMTS